MTEASWWDGAVIYQIYPRSFMDSNGDGVGDIPGIISKLDYIASLGVDAVWISPFFKSPMKDFGYDIADYRQVDPLFGTLDDFDLLIKEAHARGIKIVIDQVLSHTSDQHAWFQESRESRAGDKADWYVWADAKADGSAPNNWLSIFGGSAWQWDTRRQQYYLHNFLTSQPDLNYHSPTLRAQILEEVEFWLKRGVDGLRLDAINFCFHDKELRDNPAKPVSERLGRGFSADNPYAAQYHLYDNTQPENLEFLEELRALLDRYPGTMSMGEINSENSLETIADYTENEKRLHMGYSFELLVDDFSAAHIKDTVEAQLRHLRGSKPCWAISNHDVVRVLSRWGGDNPAPNMASMLTALVCSLPGTICSYQGEELGLTEAEIDHADLQDPFGIEFWPDFKGRDGCRTPMPWLADEKYAGFSTAAPWLPVAPDHLENAIDRQDAERTSVLNAFRAFLKWRKSQPVLLHGDIEFLDSEDGTLVFKRIYEAKTVWLFFNLKAEVSQVTLPEQVATCLQTGAKVEKAGALYELAPYEVLWGVE